MSSVECLNRLGRYCDRKILTVELAVVVWCVGCRFLLLLPLLTVPANELIGTWRSLI